MEPDGQVMRRDENKVLIPIYGRHRPEKYRQFYDYFDTQYMKCGWTKNIFNPPSSKFQGIIRPNAASNIIKANGFWEYRHNEAKEITYERMVITENMQGYHYGLFQKRFASNPDYFNWYNSKRPNADRTIRNEEWFVRNCQRSIVQPYSSMAAAENPAWSGFRLYQS